MAKIYFQGTDGAYMHQASLWYRDHLSAPIDEIRGFSSFELCWQALLETSGVDDVVLICAIENTIAGTVHENLYRLRKYDIEIIGSYDLPIDHCLCSHEDDITHIRRVYSHYVALPQCYEYLRSKGITDQVVYHDTAAAAQLIAGTREPGAAAICSTLAAELYGLHILERQIQDQKENFTRFIAIVKKGSTIRATLPSDRVTIIFETRDIPSALYHCLGVFAERSINLSKIESLPHPDIPFRSMFFLDIVGSLDDESLTQALKHLESYTESIKLLGSY